MFLPSMLTTFALFVSFTYSQYSYLLTVYALNTTVQSRASDHSPIGLVISSDQYCDPGKSAFGPKDSLTPTPAVTITD